MYPEARIPVVQLSVQPNLGPCHHWKLGEILKPLRYEEVLIVGSGTLVHNLREIHPELPPGQSIVWAAEFSQWLRERIIGFDREALLDYRRQAPNAERAHPTDEHLVPLFTAMGAASPARRTDSVDMGFYYGTLLMDSYLFW
jgi:4,5-DOPA dioxygenase extradiol